MGATDNQKLRRSHAILSGGVATPPVDPRESPPAVDAVEPAAPSAPPATQAATGEIGGPKGPEPTRYGDWERKGRCIDF